jgi:ribosomal protein S18 acetylase RimI-like enzyme
MLGAVVCQRHAQLKKRHEAELVGMISAPTARSQGIGKALLKEFDTLVRKLPGLEQLVLSVTASNAHAVKLYENAGFVRYGLQPRAIKVDNAYHDKALMIKEL